MAFIKGIASRDHCCLKMESHASH